MVRMEAAASPSSLLGSSILAGIRNVLRRRGRRSHLGCLGLASLASLASLATLAAPATAGLPAARADWSEVLILLVIIYGGNRGRRRNGVSRMRPFLLRGRRGRSESRLPSLPQGKGPKRGGQVEVRL
jgi:hypothetical protein